LLVGTSCNHVEVTVVKTSNTIVAPAPMGTRFHSKFVDHDRSFRRQRRPLLTAQGRHGAKRSMLGNERSQESWDRSIRETCQISDRNIRIVGVVVGNHGEHSIALGPTLLKVLPLAYSVKTRNEVLGLRNASCSQPLQTHLLTAGLCVRRRILRSGPAAPASTPFGA
jgi:hypothetical protein